MNLPRQARFLQAFGWLAVAGLFWGGVIGALRRGLHFHYPPNPPNLLDTGDLLMEGHRLGTSLV